MPGFFCQTFQHKYVVHSVGCSANFEKTLTFHIYIVSQKTKNYQLKKKNWKYFILISCVFGSVIYEIAQRYRAPGRSWRRTFKHVVGIVHTNYLAYSSGYSVWGPVLTFMLR